MPEEYTDFEIDFQSDDESGEYEFYVGVEDSLRGRAHDPDDFDRHIPGAVNLPPDELLTAAGTLLPADTLLERFVKAGIDGSNPIVLSSNVGVDACRGLVALQVAGIGHASVYDASWQDWGHDARKPVES